jgi:hypothetical protein
MLSEITVLIKNINSSIDRNLYDGEEYKILKAPESPSNELFSTFLASSFSFIIVII